MRTHNTEVVSSIPPCATLKMPLVRKTTGNHLVNSTSLEKTQPSLVSAKLEIEYAAQFFAVMKKSFNNFADGIIPFVKNYK